MTLLYFYLNQILQLFTYQYHTNSIFINHHRHHEGVASSISNGLIKASELAKAMSKYLDVYVSVDDDRMYQVSGILK